MLLSYNLKGDFKKVDSFLEKAKEVVKLGYLDKYGRMGVEALSQATPVDSGLTAKSWYYKIERDANGDVVRISFCNSNINKGVPIAIILQYGHATGNGGYVQGRDYINPAIQPIFEQIANDAWKEVQNL